MLFAVHGVVTAAVGSAGTSKEKTKLRAKLRSDEKQVDAAVQHYLKLVPFGALARTATLTTRAIACTEPSFPWTGELAPGISLTSVKGELVCRTIMGMLRFMRL